MKKLMMAAAVAAMAGGAFAENNWTNVYFVVSNKVENVLETNDFIRLPETSILTFKEAKYSTKVFSLNYKDVTDAKGKKIFKKFATGKVGFATGVEGQAIDGVIYYDYATSAWTNLWWSKSQEKGSRTWLNVQPQFKVFGDKAKPEEATKAYAAYNYSTALDGGTNAAATCYAKLKVTKNGVDTTITSVKNLDKDNKYTVKNYKDAEACKKAVDKLLKKYGNSKATEIK